jgi:hypothetical protein
VGYKKHTLRLWWREHTTAVLLLPLISWVSPANVFEGGLLAPSLHYCERRWSWWPKIVVADMSYMAGEIKALCRKRWHVAVVTRLRAEPGGVPSRRTVALVGICRAGRSALVWRNGRTDLLPAVLGSRSMPAPIRFCAERS